MFAIVDICSIPIKTEIVSNVLIEILGAQFFFLLSACLVSVCKIIRIKAGELGKILCPHFIYFLQKIVVWQPCPIRNNCWEQQKSLRARICRIQDNKCFNTLVKGCKRAEPKTWAQMQASVDQERRPKTSVDHLVNRPTEIRSRNPSPSRSVNRPLNRTEPDARAESHGSKLVDRSVDR